MSVPALRWGILGAARITRNLIPAFQAARGQTLNAVASRSADRAAACAGHWNIPRACESYEALLADPEIDAVYVPLPNHLHAPWTLRAVAAGKHVLCEKPLALTVAEVDFVREAAARAGVHVAEAFMYRHHPQTLALKALVDDGALGELRLIRSAFSFTLDRPADVRWDPAMGGGCLRDVGCYPVSFARHLAGDEPIEAIGRASVGPTGIDVSFAGLLRFASGLVALVDASFVQPFRTELEIVGSRGRVLVPRPFKPNAEEVLLVQRGSEIDEHRIAADLPLYVNQIEDFASVTAGLALPRVTLEDSRGNVDALARLLTSAGLPA